MAQILKIYLECQGVTVGTNMYKSETIFFDRGFEGWKRVTCSLGTLELILIYLFVHSWF